MAKVVELRGLIYGKYETESQLANELGWSKQRLNLITNGSREPDLEEVAALAEKLDKSVEEMVFLFLRHKSPNRQQYQTA
jgi:transcriptional regulator with XRE-family HTH domain